ncbi:MAG: SWIM zinc finger family protein [Gemmataceae bacterium]
MKTREQRGVIIAAMCKLTESHGVWVVPSQIQRDKRYTVDIQKGTCTCPDHKETGFKCKHQFAVDFTVKREQQADGSIVEHKTFMFTEKTTYTHDWSHQRRPRDRRHPRLTRRAAFAGYRRPSA